MHWPAIFTWLSAVLDSSAVVLSDSQVLLMLLVGGPHFEDHSSAAGFPARLPSSYATLGHRCLFCKTGIIVVPTS